MLCFINIGVTCPFFQLIWYLHWRIDLHHGLLLSQQVYQRTPDLFLDLFFRTQTNHLNLDLPFGSFLLLAAFLSCWSFYFVFFLRFHNFIVSEVSIWSRRGPLLRSNRWHLNNNPLCIWVLCLAYSLRHHLIRHSNHMIVRHFQTDCLEPYYSYYIVADIPAPAGHVHHNVRIFWSFFPLNKVSHTVWVIS